MKNIQLLIIAILFSVAPNYTFAQNSSNYFNEIDSKKIESSVFAIHGEVVDSTKTKYYECIHGRSNFANYIDCNFAKIKVNKIYRINPIYYEIINEPDEKYDYVYTSYAKLKPGLTAEKIKELIEKANDKSYNQIISPGIPSNMQAIEEKKSKNIKIGENYTFLLKNCNYDDIYSNELKCSPIFFTEGKIWENQSSFNKFYHKSYYTIIILVLFYLFYILWKIKNYLKLKKIKSNTQSLK